MQGLPSKTPIGMKGKEKALHSLDGEEHYTVWDLIDQFQHNKFYSKVIGTSCEIIQRVISKPGNVSKSYL